MTDFHCPNCRGGFPAWDKMECPWCGQAIDGEYEHEYPRAISEVRTDDTDDREQLGGPLYQRLFGWLE